MTITHKTNFFNTYEDYKRFITHWKSLSNDKIATFKDHMLYTILKGNDLKKAFTPVKNETKLRCSLNGNKYYNIAAAFYGTSVTFKNGSKSVIAPWAAINMDWSKVLNDDTKEKLKLYFDTKTFKELFEVE